MRGWSSESSPSGLNRYYSLSPFTVSALFRAPDVLVDSMQHFKIDHLEVYMLTIPRYTISLSNLNYNGRFFGRCSEVTI